MTNSQHYDYSTWDILNGKSGYFGSFSQLGGSLGQAMSGGASIGLALTAGANADVQASAYRWQGRQSAASLRKAGDNAVRNAGLAQKQGMDATTLRYEALGREISNQRVSTAGSGIDLSSKTAAKAAETSRINARSDITRISENTKTVTDNYALQAEEAYKNSAYAQIAGEYQAKVAQIQGDYQQFMGLLQGIPGAILGDIGLFGGGYAAVRA